MKTTLLILFLSICFFLSYACECADKPTIKSSFENSDFIFAGEVIEVNSSNVIFGSAGDTIRLFTIEISEVYKGQLFKVKSLYKLSLDSNRLLNCRTFINRGLGSCDFNFIRGKKYLVYASVLGNFLNTSICERTKLLSEVPESELNDLRALSRLERKDDNKKSIFVNKSKIEGINSQLIKIQKENKKLRYFTGILVLSIVILLIYEINKRKNAR